MIFLNLIISSFILVCATHVSADTIQFEKPKVHTAQCYAEKLNFVNRTGFVGDFFI
ncbi:hypothetical protein P253_03097 [Acinetobacter indicus CIP 110367]|uniref:Uncharacterized protein n=2 Tax=Gammaproteobacteria TaxID=1236 RepID=V2TRA9_9GAMM|nr:hypothetical protein F956_02447 [Acinetobacter indicus ANC 4215]ESK44073.1 hypothetical protein P253_03097 [Acinetobacter indicus CIP 110367]